MLRRQLEKARYPRLFKVSNRTFQTVEDYYKRCEKNWAGDGWITWTRDGIGIMFKNVEIHV